MRLVLAFILPALVIASAAIAAPRAPIGAGIGVPLISVQGGATNENVVHVGYNDGEFLRNDFGEWVEMTYTGTEFRFAEESRSVGGVLLHDLSRDVWITLDVDAKVIWYRQGEAGENVKLYDILWAVGGNATPEAPAPLFTDTPPAAPPLFTDTPPADAPALFTDTPQEETPTLYGDVTVPLVGGTPEEPPPLFSDTPQQNQHQQVRSEPGKPGANVAAGGCPDGTNPSPETGECPAAQQDGVVEAPQEDPTCRGLQRQCSDGETGACGELEAAC
jgi:hypothetical protein